MAMRIQVAGFLVVTLYSGMVGYHGLKLHI